MRVIANVRRHLNTIEAQHIADFITEGASLRARYDEVPLPVEDHNNWVGRMNSYFENAGRVEYKVRLNDFTGMTFFGDGSEKSKFKNSIDARMSRLHQFLSELTVARDSDSSEAVPSGSGPSNQRDADILLLKPSFFGMGIDLRAAWKRLMRRQK